ncbi:hypothetical protein DFH08DRAFT_979718 [Mycena albidolilacea]|uniref:Uncharacterized protein n=1 Tax=Mycena albidolilacea TaxID=1033008 RepID=A0AAD6YWK5_9AGAR|nr:hypothetical protein DFH08DRAFT_979718 [Mycena albidolilacea]
MSPMRKKVNDRAARLQTEESKEKAWQRKARYRAKPEARAKQAALMAERRATVKQRRRQWDPPNRPRPVVASPTTPQYLPSVQDLAAVNVTLTPAEEFALSALMGMAATQDSLTRNLPAVATEPPIICDDLKSDIFLLPSRSPSRESSVHAVFEQRVVKQPEDDRVFAPSLLPAYASPASSLQKKVFRETGLLGPLTGVQRVQWIASRLQDPDDEIDDDEILPAPVLGGNLSSERWQGIRSWRRHHMEYETAWGAVAVPFIQCTLPWLGGTLE